MARVPTWTELRLDATKLANLHKGCYHSVHRLLDSDLPELDRKISSLRSEQNANICQTIRPFSSVSHPTPPSDVIMHEPEEVEERPKTTTINRSHTVGENLSNRKVKATDTRKKMTANIATQVDGLSFLVDECQTDEPVTRIPNTSSVPNFMQAEVVQIEPKSKPPHRPKVAVKQVKKKVFRPAKIDVNELDNLGLMHLKPPPKPLSEYLKSERPEVVERADERVRYLRACTEARKSTASDRIINSLKKIRLSSRNGSADHRNNHYYNQNAPKLTNGVTHEPQIKYRADYQVKCKITEQEMKRLTAKIYRKLPEVKKLRKEEVKNYMRIQNYKNKLEYGRKLIENRKHGIINYPLRPTSSNDDRSICSSQDDSFYMNVNRRSADAFASDPFY